MRKKNYKRCPRCDRKVPLHEPKCQHCGLIFARLSKATNKAAKKALRKGEKNKVIYDNILPRDMKKWKLVLMTLLLGWVGGHNYYVGKIGKGIVNTITFSMILTAVFLPVEWWNHYYLSTVLWVLIIPYSFSFIFWIISIFAVIFNRFKVPIAIDETLVLNEDYDAKMVKEVLSEVKGLNKDKKDDKNTKEKDSKQEVKEKQVKPKMVKVVCKNCGQKVKIEEGSTICPNCEENVNGED